MGDYECSGDLGEQGEGSEESRRKWSEGGKEALVSSAGKGIIKKVSVAAKDKVTHGPPPESKTEAEKFRVIGMTKKLKNLGGKATVVI